MEAIMIKQRIKSNFRSIRRAIKNAIKNGNTRIIFKLILCGFLLVKIAFLMTFCADITEIIQYRVFLVSFQYKVCA
ncbi:hypothetical protein DP187_21285 [Enterobacter cloacae]|nr:hypothetical protein DP187_21285 [Enterobacter cloacae]